MGVETSTSVLASILGASNMDEDFEQHDEGPRYADPETIGGMALYQALSNLVFFSDDMYLRSQAQNLNLVDQFLMPLEYKVLQELTETDSTPASTYFLHMNCCEPGGNERLKSSSGMRTVDLNTN
jgi:hypothetical protein